MNGPLRTAFVLGGGGVLGSAEVGMLQALTERDVVPDLVIGSSVGALNGAMFATDPTMATVERMKSAWMSLSKRGAFSGSVFGQLRTLARHGTHLHENAALRALLNNELRNMTFEDLAVPFECVAASIERAAAHWFSTGLVTDAVLASCAVPGLLPAVEIDGEHYLDGGLVRSIPIGRAVELGAKRIFVLHVGRLERPLQPPARPWEVALVAFEIGRRHHFEEEMSALPDDVELHVLPTGSDAPPLSIRYRSTSGVGDRIEAAYVASAKALDAVAAEASSATE